MNLGLFTWVKDGKYRLKTLELLQSKPLLPSELASILNINRSSMSRILKDLKEKNLVMTFSNNSRTTTYTITSEGEDILLFFNKFK